MADNDKYNNNDYQKERRVISYPPAPIRNKLEAASQITGFSQSHIITQALDSYFKSLPKETQERISKKATNNSNNCF